MSICGESFYNRNVAFDIKLDSLPYDLTKSYITSQNFVSRSLAWD
jgi:hypothetical protein